MSIRFSFIVPVYNCRAYLPECVDSIISQAIDDYEILLIDDGSTDGSDILCDEIRQSLPNIRVIHKKNGGAASARNVGIEHSHGEYLMFIDCDDTYTPNCFSEFLPVLTDTSQLPIFGMAFDYWQDGILQRTEMKSMAFHGQFETGCLAEKLADFFRDNVLSSACNKVFRASVIHENKLRFPEGMTLYEDFAFVLTYLLHVDSIYCIPQPIYHYRISTNLDHYSQRFLDLDKLQDNLQRLNRALLDFGAFCQAPIPAASLAADLSLQLLSYHLLWAKHSAKDLRRILPAFCSDPLFQEALSQRPSLSTESRLLLDNIEKHHFQTIHRQYCIKRWKSALRKLAKQFRRHR